MPHLGQTPPNLGPGATPFGVTAPQPTFGVAIFGVSVFGGQLLATPQLTPMTYSLPPNLQP